MSYWALPGRLAWIRCLAAALWPPMTLCPTLAALQGQVSCKCWHTFFDGTVKKNLGAERRVKVTATPTNTHLVDRTRRWTLRRKISFSGWEANWYLLTWWLILLQWKIIIKKPSCFLVAVHLPEPPCMNNYQKQTAENASSCPLLPVSCEKTVFIALCWPARLNWTNTCLERDKK